MRLHPLGVIAVVALAVAAGASTAPWLQWLLAVAGLFGGVAVVIGAQCGHRHATLLPPVHDAGPDRDHARWYCDQCGYTWDARLTAARAGGLGD